MTKDNIGKKMEIQIPDNLSTLHFNFDENSHLKLQNPPKSFCYANYDLWNHEFYVPPCEDREIISSIEDWECYMYCKEHEIRSRVMPVTDLPPIRNSDRLDNTIRFSSEKYRRNLFSYPNREVRFHYTKRNDDINEEEESKKLLKAEAEKVRGNDAYKAEDFLKACEHYSNCIALIPLKEAYNNRAQANMKLGNYITAIPDLNEVLKIDPFNEKALYRRAICRREIRMYNEALKDAEAMLEKKPGSKVVLTVVNSIKKEMAKLNGKTYRIRENFDSKKTFQIDVTQLPIYTQCENDYLVEVDKTGCVKSCVCGYCLDEDRRTRFRSTSLRIKERDRWKRLTPTLLDEMRISLPSVTVSKDLKEIRNSEYPANINKLINDKTNNIHKTHEIGTSSSNQSDVTNCLQTKHSKSIIVNENVQKIVNSSSYDNNFMKNESNSIKNNKNMRDQQWKHFEELFKNMHLNSQQPSSLNSFKKKFDSRLDYDTLTNMIKYVCQLLRSETDWKLVSAYLSIIASLERFNIIVNFVDESVRNDLNSILTKAIDLNLENATKLKKLYFNN